MALECLISAGKAASRKLAHARVLLLADAVLVPRLAKSDELVLPLLITVQTCTTAVTRFSISPSGAGINEVRGYSSTG
jgi:hypothetical protein